MAVLFVLEVHQEISVFIQNHLETPHNAEPEFWGLECPN